ncbi:MAG: FkbM family methyltransferase [Phycisphaerae bacterium]|nr:FkbM family methyltransferase [Phycisphaerae bacterium]
MVIIIKDWFRNMCKNSCDRQEDSVSKKTVIEFPDSLNEVDRDAEKFKDFSDIARLAILADEFFQAGCKYKAVEYIKEGCVRVYEGQSGRDIPQEIFNRWKTSNEQILFSKMLLRALYSSYYCTSSSFDILQEWCRLEPQNVEPHIRFGLVAAYNNIKSGTPPLEDVLSFLSNLDRQVSDERVSAILALAKGQMRELSLPYDGCRIHLYPEISNITTYSMLETGDWFEQEDLGLFRKLVKPGDNVLDLGANVGVYSLSAAVRTGSEGCVVSVEPSSRTFGYLNTSAKQFGHMKCFHCGVSDSSGVGMLSFGASSELNRFTVASSENEQGEQVQLMSVDDVAEKAGVDRFDIIKMDVEGFEEKVIAGAKKIIHDNSPVIIYEVNENGSLDFSQADIFKKLGYDSYFYVPSGSRLIEYVPGVEVDKFVLNMFAIRPESLTRFEGIANIEKA